MSQKQLTEPQKLKVLQILHSYHIQSEEQLPQKLARYGHFVSLPKCRTFIRELKRFRLLAPKHGRLTIEHNANKVLEMYNEKTLD